MTLQRIGVRELKEHASEIRRRVRHHHDMYGITYRRRAIASLVPITEPGTAQSPESFWTELDRIAAEIGTRWPEGVTAGEAVAEQRRKL